MKTLIIAPTATLLPKEKRPPEWDATLTWSFYMGDNTDDRRQYIVDNLRIEEDLA